MSIWQTIVTWIEDRRENNLHRELIKKADNSSLQKFLRFIIDHDRLFPISEKSIRTAVFNTDSWSIAEPYQERLFTSVEEYLFHQVQPSDAQEWLAWAREARRLERAVDANNPVTAQSIQDAYKVGKLNKLPKQDIDYLVGYFWRAFPTIPKKLGDVNNQEVFPILLEYVTSAQKLDRHRFAEWILDKRATILHERFIKSPNASTLTDLFAFAMKNDRPFPIEQPLVRNALFGLNLWQVPKAYQEPLFLSAEGYLFANITASQPKEWRAWLAASRQAGRHLDVLNPITANALLNAFNASQLANLPQNDFEYLLGCYLREYGEVLERTDPSNQQALPVLLEFAAIVQLIGPDESYLKVLRRWVEQKPVHPRSLTSLTDKQASHAPRWGVGSPHSLSITFYHDSESNLPTRIVCAGTTHDATLNSQTFASLFAAALACDSEPTFLMPGGCALSLQTQHPSSEHKPPQKLGNFVIGPAGPVEPNSSTPTIGMDVQEALALIADSFERAQEATGLVQVKHWRVADAQELEKQIRAAFESHYHSTQIIKSSGSWSEGAGVVHAIPLLHRNKSGAVLPIEIEIPYSLLGSERIFDLLLNARQGYMEQLITAGRKRHTFSEQVYETERANVLRWHSSSPEAKQDAIKRTPFIYITHEVNFDLGIRIKLGTPKPIPLQQYEDQMRPGLRDMAKIYAERFAALVKKLQSLNTPGGRADLLTFKLLVDAMIRQDYLPVANSDIQSEYKKWVEVSAIPVWAVIQEWATKRGLTPDALATDNILFESRLQVNPQRVIIQPWVMVDLHDFVIQVDSDKGLMKVLPGSQMVTLDDTLVPEPEHGVQNLRSLHEAFCRWAEKMPSLREPREAQAEALKSGILKDTKLYPLIQLNKAKQYLFNGNADRAVQILDALRRYDLAAVYFWGACAYEYQYMADNKWQFIGNLNNFKESEHSIIVLNASLSALSNYSKAVFTASPVSDLYLDQTTGTMRQRIIPTCREAESYLSKLQSKDPAFIEGLMAEKPDINRLERQSLGLLPDEERRIQAATSAMASIEFLNLAENIKNMAKELPFTGGLSYELRQKISRIIEQGRSLMFRDSIITSQIEELSRLYGEEQHQPSSFKKQLSDIAMNVLPPQGAKNITTDDSKLYGRLLSCLRACKEDFVSHQSLETVFTDARIEDWLVAIPQMGDVASRINALIGFLIPKFHPETRENALVLFLHVLGKKKNIQDNRRQELLDLSHEFEKRLHGPVLIVEDALLASHKIFTLTTQAHAEAHNRELVVDAWALAGIKRHLHVLSEIIAKAAEQEALWASSVYPNDFLTLLIPLIVDLRWYRGYASGLNRILNIPVVQKRLQTFHLESSDPICPVMDGVLSAELQKTDQVLIRLDGHPAALVGHLASTDIQLVLNGVNNYGRLGVPEAAGMSLLDRIGAIPFTAKEGISDPIARILFRNREALVPLIARWGMPGAEWLLPDEEVFPQSTQPLLDNTLQSVEDQDSLIKAKESFQKIDDLVETEFLARKAYVPNQMKR